MGENDGEFDNIFGIELPLLSSSCYSNEKAKERKMNLIAIKGALIIDWSMLQMLFLFHHLLNNYTQHE